MASAPQPLSANPSSSPDDPDSSGPLVAAPASPFASFPQAHSHGFAVRAAWVALGINLLIAGLKLSVNYWFSPSAALFSEGLHSLGDALNSIILLIGLSRGNRQPDRTHPFGYGLEMNLWALIASFLLFLSAGWAIWEGVEHFYHPTLGQHYGWAIAVLSVSLAFELYAMMSASQAVLAEVGIQGRWFNSILLGFQHVHQVQVPTTRYVFFEDTLAFVGAFVALVAITSSQWLVALGWLPAAWQHLPDAVGSIIIGGLLFGLAWQLFGHNKGILIHSAAPATLEADLQTVVLNTYGVSQIMALRTIDQGHAGLLIHMTVEVDPDLPVRDMDDLTDRIKARLADRFRNVLTEQVFIEVQADDSEDRWDKRFEALLADGVRQEILTHRQEALLIRARDFSDLRLEDVMVPRTDVDYVNVDATIRDVADLMATKGHTRWPVFRENVDDLLGFVHARDVFQHLHYQQDHVSLQDLLREMRLYPETKRVGELLEDFKRNKLQIAAVADEYGGFAGIVTIEDLMEEIIGEIWDETDVEETLIEPLSGLQAGWVRVSGKANIEELNERLETTFPTEEFVTIGGFVFGQLGREPEIDDVIHFEDWDIRVEAVDGPRIVTLLLSPASALPPSPDVP
ncbi:MAG: cation diffusion facilitator family transporter [Vampirovibrionales bacterium]